MLLNTHLFIIGVFAVIFDSSKRVLLCHRTDIDLWDLPSGAMEQGETPWEAAVREIEPDKIPPNTNHEQVEALEDVLNEELQATLRRQPEPSPREVYFSKQF